MKKQFLDLGRHPIANAFLQKEDFKDEFLFDLKVCLDTKTKLVSIKDFVEPERIFNKNYPYNTSNSFPMIEHFKNTAKKLIEKFQPTNVLEIGSNSGPFIENFKQENSICVEPCSNFAGLFPGADSWPLRELRQVTHSPSVYELRRGLRFRRFRV